MPGRIVREGYLDSVRVNQLDAPAERFYFRLLLVVDDYGRCECNPTKLKSWCFPVREDIRSTDIPRWVAACEKAGLVATYEVSGQQYIQVFRVGRPRADRSKFPDPPLQADANKCLQTQANAPLSYPLSNSNPQSLPLPLSTADQKKPQRKQLDEERWRDVEKAIRCVLNSEDAKAIVDHGRREYPDCPEAAERRYVGWSIEARSNCKDPCKAKYVLNCREEPSDVALDEYKRVMAKIRGEK